jgi:hypothetical protein
LGDDLQRLIALRLASYFDLVVRCGEASFAEEDVLSLVGDGQAPCRVVELFEERLAVLDRGDLVRQGEIGLGGRGLASGLNLMRSMEVGHRRPTWGDSRVAVWRPRSV